MGALSWYKRDPDAALQGMFELTLEERGAYNTVLDLIYSRADNLPDDDRYISGCCGCDLRVWRRIKKTLIERGKLHLDDGFVRNTRATSDVLRALAKVASCRQAARTKHAKSTDVLAKNNGLALANAEQTHVPRARARILDSKKDSESPKRDSSEAKASAAPNGSADATVVDFKKPCYDLGKQILGSRYGALITDALKTKPPDQVLKLLQAAQGKHNPTAYFTGALVKSVKQQGLDLCRA